MIQCKCNYFSKLLKYNVDVNVLLPSPSKRECPNMSLDEIYGRKGCYPTLYLLHGSSGDCNSWIRLTNLERYVQDTGMAVVMPSGQNSFYCDAEFGENFFSYTSQELVAFTRSIFPLSTKREDTFIAGASMGGYGAARIALDLYDQFSAFGVFGGSIDPLRIEQRLKAIGVDEIRFDLLFGDTNAIKGSRHDLFKLVDRIPEDANKPRAWIYCGEEDIINLDMSTELHKALLNKGYESHFDSNEGGHDWEYWDYCIENFVSQLLKNR